MIIDCISDLHGFYPKLEGGDLLIVAGDLTGRDEHTEYLKFFQWMIEQPYKKYIFIAGNHDMYLEKEGVQLSNMSNVTYLCDSGIEFEGLNIWGSPWTLQFKGENPDCLAFTCKSEIELAKKWDCIPEDTDILITHSPSFMVRDETIFNENVGSMTLLDKTRSLNNLRLHVFGHIHESYGGYQKMNCTFINVSHVNENYEPVNDVVRIEYE